MQWIPEEKGVIDKSAAKRIATLLGWQPKREWVGLTYLEIDQIYCDSHDDDGRPLSIKKYERAIEAKLKEKNT
jgi:hypothetical protein